MPSPIVLAVIIQITLFIAGELRLIEEQVVTVAIFFLLIIAILGYFLGVR